MLQIKSMNFEVKEMLVSPVRIDMVGEIRLDMSVPEILAIYFQKRDDAGFLITDSGTLTIEFEKIKL